MIKKACLEKGECVTLVFLNKLNKIKTIGDGVTKKYELDKITEKCKFYDKV